MKDGLAGIFSVLAVLFIVGLWGGLSLLYFSALMDGCNYLFQTSGTANFFLAFLFAGLPPIGIIFGLIGATQMWGWGIGQALLVFIGPYALPLLVSIFQEK